MKPSMLITSHETANKLLNSGENFDSLISLGQNDLDKFDSFVGPKLRLTFNDVDLPSKEHIEPAVEDIEQIIDFSAKIKDKCLIHCHAGKSRSSAAAYITYCNLLGKGAEQDAIDLILESAMEDIFPNGRMVYIADVLLDREERMWEEYVNYFGKIINHHRNLELIKSETRKYIVQYYPDSILKFKHPHKRKTARAIS